MRDKLILILVVVSLILNVYLFTEINKLKENAEYCVEKLNYVFEFFSASMQSLDITYEENENYSC